MAVLNWHRVVASAGVTLFLSGCQVGPDYARPQIDLGENYLYTAQGSGWASTQTVHLATTLDWWALYQDSQLNELMARLNAGSPSIEQAQAQYRQSLALMRVANASLYPVVGLNAEVTRADVPIAGSSGAVMGAFGPNTQHSVGLGLSWEVDLWGALAREVERTGSQSQASAADLAGARLSAQTALASSYFQLRGLEQQQRLLQKTIQTYERSLTLTQNLFRAGLSDRSDVSVAQTQLEAARSQSIELQRQRATLANAIAVLMGEPPSRLLIKPDLSWKADVVTVPAGVPSMLLVRRPDIVAAERRVAAANAQLGVTTAAWFPSLTISANAGYQANQFSQWFVAPAQFWAVGPVLAATLFDAGRRSARIAQAQAELDVQAANYRFVALRALQEVEDALVQLRLLQEQQQVQHRAVAAARESVRMKRQQYEKGLVDFLSVAVLETTALNAERTEIALQTDRLASSVKLVSAMGGGWSVDQLPDPRNSVRTP